MATDFPVVEYLHHPFGCVNIYFLVDQEIRDRIAVLIKFDMVIDIHRGCFYLGIDIRLFGQGPQVRSIDLFELLAAVRPTDCMTLLFSCSNFSLTARLTSYILKNWRFRSGAMIHRSTF